MLLFKMSVFIVLLFFLNLFSYNILYAADYLVGVRANQGVEQAKAKWQPTLDYLTKSIPGHSFKFMAVALDEITAKVSRGELDFMLASPSSYVEIQELHDARALVTLNNKRGSKTAQTRFGSIIFTRADNDTILRIKDLKGRSLMAVAKNGFGGWRVAWFEMLKQGIDPFKDLKSVSFSKNKIQKDVVFSVRDGKVDAGVVRTDRLERMAKKGQIDLRYFRVLGVKDTKGFPFFHSTDLYPEWPFAATKAVSDDLANQVKMALMAIPADSPAAIKGKYVGWVSALDYSSVNELLKRIQVGPYINLKPQKNSFNSSIAVLFGAIVVVLLMLFLWNTINNNNKTS